MDDGFRSDGTFRKGFLCIYNDGPPRIGDGMGFLESLRDKELRGLYRARKLIENADLQLAAGTLKRRRPSSKGQGMSCRAKGLKESPHSKD
jgi:hypothetical protein